MDSLVLNLDTRINRLKALAIKQPGNLRIRQRIDDLLAQQQAALLDTSQIRAALNKADALILTVKKSAAQLVIESRAQQIEAALQQGLFPDAKEAEELLRELAELYIQLESS